MTTEFRPVDRIEDRIVPRLEFSAARPRNLQKAWDGRVVPAGATGTIVEVLGGGREYVLDFIEPYDAVATVGLDELEDNVAV